MPDFKKKKDSQLIQGKANQLNFLLGNESTTTEPTPGSTTKISRSLILKSAMFWDTKSRVERIKSLMLTAMSLTQFEDCQDFQIDQLGSIQMLSLSKNMITNLQPISVLESLSLVNINSNKVYDLSPLSNLVLIEELYAANNQIKNIDPLRTLQKVRVLNLYNNSISRQDEPLAVLTRLPNLIDLDIENNPAYDPAFRRELVQLPINRLNGELVPQSERHTLSDAQHFSNMASSCVINPLSFSMMQDTKTSFYQSTHSSKLKYKEFQSKLEGLENQYKAIDDEFEDEIYKSVKLKEEYCRKLQEARQKETQEEDVHFKSEEVKLLKRKVKNLKQELFTKDRKGDLLRSLFELQTRTTQKPQNKKTQKEDLWMRKFDCDDVILIESNNKYLQEEIASLVNSNTDAVHKMRMELRSLY